MTVLQLLALISAALLMQLAAGLAWAWRRQRPGRADAKDDAKDDAVPPQRSGAAWEGWREFRVIRREQEDRARTQCSFHLRPVDGRPLPDFAPGQFLTFLLTPDGHASAATDGRPSVTRCYSLSDGPDPAHYRVTIRRVLPPAEHPDVAPGLASNHFHDHVQEGDVVLAKAPSGHFRLDPDPTAPVVLIAGGIGITPLMSMLLWIGTRQPRRVVHLYYGLRNGDEHVFRDAMAQTAATLAAFSLHIVYSRPTATDVLGRDYQHAGHVDLALLRRTLPRGGHQFYVCGPPAMMQVLVPGLLAWGVPLADLHFEAFGPASVRLPGRPEPMATGTRGLEVHFRRASRTLTWDGKDDSLLDFAERHGIAVESGCRSGACGSCETQVLQGSVEYGRDPDHDVAPGHCLLCIGRPGTALALET